MAESTRSSASAGPPRISRTAVLLFTDIEGSVSLKAAHGDVAYADALAAHDAAFRSAMQASPGGRILKDTGDGFMAELPTSGDAVTVALLFQAALRATRGDDGGGRPAIDARVGIHQGQILELEPEPTGLPKVVGAAADLAARLMGLAKGGQILVSRAVFDDARQYVREHPAAAAAGAICGEGRDLRWVAHGSYQLHGWDDALEVFEVVPACREPLRPASGQHARRIDDSRAAPHLVRARPTDPNRRFPVHALLAALLLIAGIAAVVGRMQYARWKADWRAYCTEYTGWFKPFLTEYEADGDLRDTIEADPYLKEHVLAPLEAARAANVRLRLQDISGRTLTDDAQAADVPLNRQAARDTRAALHLVRTLRARLEGPEGIGLNDLAATESRWRDRGWLGPANYLAELRRTAQLRPDASFAAAIVDARDAQSAIGGIEGLWTAVEEHRATLEATDSEMLQRYGALVRRATRIEPAENGRESLLFLARILNSARNEGKALTDAFTPQRAKALNWPKVREWERSQPLERFEDLRAWPDEILKNDKYRLDPARARD